MRVFVFILFITVLIVKPVYPAQENIVLEDRELIAMETFPVYQRNDNSNVISNIKPGDRIRSILSYSDSPNWILVKTPENWMGWVDRITIDLFTRPPSLEMGDYVTEGYADLDGDGDVEFIQIKPLEWYTGSEVVIDGVNHGFFSGESDAGFNILYVYRDGKFIHSNPYGADKVMIKGDGILYKRSNIPLGESYVKSIFNSEKDIFEDLDQHVFYLNSSAEVTSEIQIFPWIYSDKCMLTLKVGETVTLLACQEKDGNPASTDRGSDYWYLIKTSEDILGWVEFRNLRNKLELPEWNNEEKYVESACEDLNGDGVIENIRIDINRTSYSFRDPDSGELVEGTDYDGKYTLHVGDASIDEDEDECWICGFKIEDIDKADGCKEVFVEISDASYVYAVVYRFDGENIHKIGEILGYWEIRDGYIFKRNSNGYWTDQNKLVVDNITQQITPVHQDMYYLGFRIQVRNDFPIYCSPESTEIAASLKKGEIVEILAYDTDYPVKEFDWYGFGAWFRMDYWHLIRTDSGEVGWAQLSTLTKNFILPQTS